MEPCGPALGKALIEGNGCSAFRENHRSVLFLMLYKCYVITGNNVFLGIRCFNINIILHYFIDAALCNTRKFSSP